MDADEFVQTHRESFNAYSAQVKGLRHVIDQGLKGFNYIGGSVTKETHVAFMGDLYTQAIKNDNLVSFEEHFKPASHILSNVKSLHEQVASKTKNPADILNAAQFEQFYDKVMATDFSQTEALIIDTFGEEGGYNDLTAIEKQEYMAVLHMRGGIIQAYENGLNIQEQVNTFKKKLEAIQQKNKADDTFLLDTKTGEIINAVPSTNATKIEQYHLVAHDAPIIAFDVDQPIL